MNNLINISEFWPNFQCLLWLKMYHKDKILGIIIYFNVLHITADTTDKQVIKWYRTKIALFKKK